MKQAIKKKKKKKKKRRRKERLKFYGHFFSPGADAISYD